MRQLDLFKGKRQRGKLPPAPYEFQDQCFLVDLLKRWINPGWHFTHIASGEYRDKITAGRLKRMGVMPGWPDLIFLGPDKRVLFVELKRRGETPSEAQQHIAFCIIAAGHSYFWSDDIKLTIERLQQIGVLSDRVEVQ